jgi:hypothetical protein
MEIEPYNLIRMLVVVISGLSIYFGYRLFAIVTERQGQLKISNQESSLELSDVGPGVFFSLFGSIVLISVLWTQPYAQTEIKDDGAGTTSSSRSPASIIGTSDNSARKFNFDYDLLCVDSDFIQKISAGSEVLDFLSEKSISEPYAMLDEETKIKMEDVFRGEVGNEYEEIIKNTKVNIDAYNLMGSFLIIFSLKHPC